ncbi:hypothetical protein [Altericista sp. CCNU0014]|uniref:hypothetical protein n=1 Tax=Altericista sp. CCNU0014 TaxID=3082949 RepID=UPI00384D9D61
MFRQDQNSTSRSEKVLQHQDLESISDELSDDQLDCVVGGNTLDMLSLQNKMNQRNLQMDMLSNIMFKTSQTNNQIIRNMS